MEFVERLMLAAGLADQGRALLDGLLEQRRFESH
jgi:hypothetical protein